MPVTAIADSPAARPAASAEQPIDPTAPHWPRFALAALLAVTALLYLWALSTNGYGNAFYAAASQSGAQSWSAWFFGSLDPNNFVTVDKPPAATWVSGLSVRLFGMNSWSVLAPQALIGVATVGVLYAAVRRVVADPQLGPAAGLLAGAACALTPVSVLIFRYNNPDALMVLLITIGAYCVARAVQTASWRWLALVGVALGFAFLTKMLEGLLVLPAFACAYLLFAPTLWWKRLTHLVFAGLTLIVAAGWWVLTVQLWPTDARPYISNSGDNSVLNLALGYNGVNRLIGGKRHGTAVPPQTPTPASEVAPPVAPAHHSASGSQSGLHRLFVAEMGNEISWLLPVALFALCFGVYLGVRHLLSRDEKAALVTWGGWLVLCGVVFSYMDGMVHPYYTVAMTPAVGALIGLGGVWAWRRRTNWDGRAAMAAMIAISAAWGVLMLHRADLGSISLRWGIGVVAAAGIAAVVAASPRWPRLLPVAAIAGLLAGFGGTAAFAIATAATPHDGAIPSAVHTGTMWPTVGNRFGSPVLRLGDLQTNIALGEALRGTSTRWSAAVIGSQSASALEVTSGTAVMAIGGWSDDPVPTLDQFIDDVRAGQITYFVDSGRGHAMAPYGRAIAEWVVAHYPVANIGGTKVYHLV
ncbi:ArnT family glycosyltransferase [Mycolicibacterium komossense]|uniref:Glycosyltransferase family 39 protein n=1 Tax=Mycolicibacterium komossense TaxID=1779 RepID=A0ABT3CFR9_9MYCO|nr:glycosyltransferase family 39 protein [Mycolicibacterium komossense]